MNLKLTYTDYKTNTEKQEKKKKIRPLFSG